MAFSKAYYRVFTFTLFVVLLSSQLSARELADATQPWSSEYSYEDGNHFKTQNWRDSKLDGTPKTLHNGFPGSQTSKFASKPGSHAPSVKTCVCIGDWCFGCRGNQQDPQTSKFTENTPEGHDMHFSDTYANGRNLFHDFPQVEDIDDNTVEAVTNAN